MKKKSIILIGFMGCGKSSLGRKLAKAFHYSFYDTDSLIEERLHKKISCIFAEEGEEFFRKEETKQLRLLSENEESFVLATGGGLPMREENVALLHSMGTVVYLSATPEMILSRLQKDTSRPLLAHTEKEERVRSLMKERHPIYLAASDYCIDTIEKSFYAIISEMEKKGLVTARK